MDDNENFLEYSKMNFSPFTQFTGLQTNAVNQFSAAKFSQNITTSNGQVVSLVSSGDGGGLQFLRPMDASQFAATPQAAAQQNHQQTFITLPITMPGAKPGDAQQTVQIQVLNPNPMPQQQMQKFQMGQMQIPIQTFPQGTTVLTVAYNPQDGEILTNHGLPEEMTVVAALQPQDLQLFANAHTMSTQQQLQQLQQQHQQQQLQLQQHQQQQQQQQQQQLQQQQQQEMMDNSGVDSEQDNDKAGEPEPMTHVVVKQEPLWGVQQTSIPTLTTADLTEYINQQQRSLNLQQFLRFNSEQPVIKKEMYTTTLQNGNIEQNELSDQSQEQLQQQMLQQQQDIETQTLITTTTPDVKVEEFELDTNGKIKKKRKYKKKPPKPKRPKPGQVHIATALDGTLLFCCPECQLAYPEKECLENHLAVHKIERRFICDICGAGLKRKEHLERHKLGHNPDRPYVCSVCEKGFKRKEHLNLHFVIHSGLKTEICGECGKGFYRKDHLRKHVKSHMAKRLKLEMINAQEIGGGSGGSAMTSPNTSDIITTTSGDFTSMTNTIIKSEFSSNNNNHLSSITTTSCLDPIENVTLTKTTKMVNARSAMVAGHLPTTIGQPTTICLPQQEVTIHVPTSNNTTLPVQIHLPQLVAQTTTSSDGTTSTIVMPQSESIMHQQMLQQQLQLQQQQHEDASNEEVQS